MAQWMRSERKNLRLREKACLDQSWPPILAARSVAKDFQFLAISHLAKTLAMKGEHQLLPSSTSTLRDLLESWSSTLKEKQNIAL